MEFSSLEEMISFIEGKMNSANSQLADKMVEIAKQETEKEQNKYTPSPNGYQRTGDLLSCIKPTLITKDLVEITWQNSGNWKSYRGNSFYAPKGLEEGTTFGRGGYRPATNFVEMSENKIQSELPKCYKQIMNSLGIPII